MISGYVIAVMLEALARWIDDELAGGVPAKWVAIQAAAGCRYIAVEAKAAELTEGR